MAQSIASYVVLSMGARSMGMLITSDRALLWQAIQIPAEAAVYLMAVQTTRARRSPDGLDGILLNERISRENGQLLQLALGHQETIKGVTMDMQGVSEVDGQTRDVVADQMLRHKWCQIVWDL